MKVVPIPKCVNYNGANCAPYLQKRGKLGQVTNFGIKKISLNIKLIASTSRKFTVLVINVTRNYYK